MLKRLKRLWNLSKKDHKLVDKFTDEVITNLPLEGDGKAEFFGEGSEEEFKKMKQDDEGISKWLNRLQNLK